VWGGDGVVVEIYLTSTNVGDIGGAKRLELTVCPIIRRGQGKAEKKRKALEQN